MSSNSGDAEVKPNALVAASLASVHVRIGIGKSGVSVTQFVTHWSETDGVKAGGRQRGSGGAQAMERPSHCAALMTYVDPGPDALVFTGPKGGALRRAHFNNLTRWVESVEKLGVRGLHFYHLRHTGDLLVAPTCACVKDLMSRMGHDDMRQR